SEEVPAAPVSVEFVSVVERLDGLRQNRYDAVVLVDFPDVPQGWRSRIIQREHLFVALPVEHALAGDDTLDLDVVSSPILVPPWLDPLTAQASARSFPTLTTTSPLAKVVMKKAAESGRSSQPPLPIEPRLQLVAAGKGVTLVLESS